MASNPDHTALADFAAILDMEHLEAAGVFVEIVDGACLAHHGPVYVQFDEQVFRVGVFDHVVQHDSLVLDLLAMLIGAGEEHDIAAGEPLIAGHGVSGHRAVGVSDVELVGG